MPGLIVAVVEVAVVHRDQVHVAEDEAVVRGLLQRLPVADIQQLGPVESVFAQLWEHTKKNKFTLHLHKEEEERDDWASSGVIRFSDVVRELALSTETQIMECE